MIIINPFITPKPIVALARDTTSPTILGKSTQKLRKKVKRNQFNA